MGNTLLQGVQNVKQSDRGTEVAEKQIADRACSILLRDVKGASRSKEQGFFML